MEQPFYKMQEYPRLVKGEDFSETVIVFNEDDYSYCELGYYDFKDKEWNIFSEMSIKLICWCYPPNPKEFLNGKNFSAETHIGYRP